MNVDEVISNDNRLLVSKQASQHKHFHIFNSDSSIKFLEDCGRETQTNVIDENCFSYEPNPDFIFLIVELKAAKNLRLYLFEVQELTRKRNCTICLQY